MLRPSASLLQPYKLKCMILPSEKLTNFVLKNNWMTHNIIPP
nr:MAG TPA: hypothetical protein [Caudoviricetes sp.]